MSGLKRMCSVNDDFTVVHFDVFTEFGYASTQNQ